jgi:Ca2+-binding RTX toxin-like protein
VGDVNGDGIADVTIGCPRLFTSYGYNALTHVFFGSRPDQAVTRAGTAIANHIFGGAFADTLNGLAGADTLDGGGEADMLNGGAGADTMIGGAGNDTYIVDNAGDVTSETSLGDGIDLVRSSMTRTLTSYVENLTLIGAGAINGTGNGLNNVITGNGAVNILTGVNGNDTLNGLGGADTMIGGAGNDTYVVNDTNDVTTESSVSGGVDLVKSSVTRLLGANLENLTLTGAAAIDGTGNGLNNTLVGNNAANLLSGANGNDALTGAGGADTLGGGNGADTLNGGLGNDTLTGGANADKFVFNVAANAANADTIADFTQASDRIQLENSVFTGLGAATGFLAGAKFWIGPAAHDADDRIIYDNATGALYYDSDGNAAAHAQVLIATLTGAPTLAASDIVVI